jgi:hypothetical protein
MSVKRKVTVPVSRSVISEARSYTRLARASSGTLPPTCFAVGAHDPVALPFTQSCRRSELGREEFEPSTLGLLREAALSLGRVRSVWTQAAFSAPHRVQPRPISVGLVAPTLPPRERRDGLAEERFGLYERYFVAHCASSSAAWRSGCSTTTLGAPCIRTRQSLRWLTKGHAFTRGTLQIGERRSA